MKAKTILVRKEEFSKTVGEIIEARKNPKFMEFIREFVKYHTS